MTLALGIAAVAVLLVMAIRLEAGRKKRKIEAVFSGRPSLQPVQFYEKYFKDKGVPLHVAEGVRAILEQLLSADMSRLADSDDFSRNLNFFWDFDSMADVEIVCALEEKFGIVISDDEAGKCHTVDDIVNLVWHKLGARSEV